MAVVKRAIEYTKTDFVVICGIRTIEEQELLVRKGASQTMNSKHLTGNAVDVAALVNGRVTWDNEAYIPIANAFIKAAASEDPAVKMRWGAAWNCDDIGACDRGAAYLAKHYITTCVKEKKRPFIDSPHFELA